jgi:Zn finger protein HypA/HybF involved in hydrogenase expression
MTSKKLKYFNISAINILIAFILFCTYLPVSKAENNDSKKKVYTSKKANDKCFKCHANRKYGIASADDSNKIIFRKMPLDYMIDTAEYYSSNHWDFKCNECHSDEYKNIPHNQELRFNDIPNCIDCHGGDQNYAKYRFEVIEDEYQKSVHFKRKDKDFSCWSCHNPHSYKINARNKHLKITQTVEYDNTICLGCHDNNDNLKYFNKKISNIAKTHDWLPNQEDHFTKVRCIECHAVVNDSILASHNVQPKTKAVRDCAKCHSTNSILMRSLYKTAATKDKDNLGFFNSNILNDAYVAGTNRNYFLNIISVIIYSLTMLVIGVHVFFRIRKKYMKK